MTKQQIRDQRFAEDEARRQQWINASAEQDAIIRDRAAEVDTKAERAAAARGDRNN